MSYETYEVQVNSNGSQFWFQNDELHRTDGPAEIDANGSQFWYQNGKLHRADGPAAIWADGRQSWYLNGEPMSETEHAAATQPSCDGKTVEIDGKKYRLTAV